MTFHFIFAALQVFFSPNGGCEAQIVKDVSAAKRSVLVQAYSLTSKPLFAALIADQKRGVEVHVLIDGNHQPTGWQTESPDFSQLTDAGIDVLIDAKHAIAHAKVIIIDSAIVYAGSFNFTWQAEHANSEILFRIAGAQNQKQIDSIIGNFTKHAAHSVKPDVSGQKSAVR